MSGIIKNALKLSVLKSTSNVLRPLPIHKNTQGVRNFWHMSQKNAGSPLFVQADDSWTKCGCGLRAMHTRGDYLRSNKAALTKIAEFTPGEKELAEFLNEEIAAEKKLQKGRNLPSEFEGFKVKYEGSEIILTKEFQNEVIEVTVNVNHSVDMDVEGEIDPAMDKPELGEMKSRPSFDVEIKHGEKVLGFACSVVGPSSTSDNQQDSGYNDLFAIDELVMHDGDWSDSTYSVSGDVLDGTFYDLLMNLLEDKGISNEFIEKLVALSTTFEHESYINLLASVQKFVSQK